MPINQMKVAKGCLPLARALIVLFIVLACLWFDHLVGILALGVADAAIPGTGRTTAGTGRALRRM